MKDYQMTITWDSEGKCWCAESTTTLIRLILINESLDKLIEQVKYAIFDVTNENNFKVTYNMNYSLQANYNG
jgi:hypothetical protein